MPTRRVLTQRGTAASVPAEFKTMALSFGAVVYKIPYCVQFVGWACPALDSGVSLNGEVARLRWKVARLRVPAFGRLGRELRLSPAP